MGLVNGVFMGGGAKLIAYAGALRATHERGIWFGGVAGSSAGAIVASLIAAGLEPDELEAAIPAGFAKVKTSKAVRFGKAVAGTANSLFESRGLREWLDGKFVERVGHRDRSGPVSFAELHRATGIELYVITMDLSTGLPVVFSRRTTPDVEVAGAVAASSAIPGAFPAGRAVFDADGHGAVIHQLVDGASWANYPSFVFQDRSFRAWLAAEAQADRAWTPTELDDWDREMQRPVVGYLLGEADAPQQRTSIGFVPLDSPEVNRRFDLGPTYTSPKRATYLFGSLLSSDWMRLAVGIALMIWVALSVVVLPVAFRRYSTWLALWMPDALYPLALVGSLAVVVVAVLLAIAAIGGLILVGRLVAETVLPAAKAALGVPLDVAPWIGMGGDSIVVRVPREGLHAVDFDVDPVVRDTAIAAAYESVGRQLDAAGDRLDMTPGGTGQPVPSSPEPSGTGTADPGRTGWLEVAAIVVASALVGAIAWQATDAAANENIEMIVFAVLLGFVTIGAAVWYVGGRAAQRAATRAESGVGARAPRSERTSGLFVLGGIALLVAGGLLSVTAMSDRSSDTASARVVSAVVQPATQREEKPNVYRMVIEDPEDLDSVYLYERNAEPTPFPRIDENNQVIVESYRHLRLDARAFVRVGDGTVAPELVGALDDGRFAIAVVVSTLGLGMITSGVRSHRWAVRCRRLDALVTDWRQG